MPTSTPLRPLETGLSAVHLPREALRQALYQHEAEAEIALAEIAANPALPRLSKLLGASNLGRLLCLSPLDLSQALAEMAALLPQIEQLHALSPRPQALGASLARSLPSFMKGLREVCTRCGLPRALAEFEGLLPAARRRGLVRPWPDSGTEAETLLALLWRLAGGQVGREPPGSLPMGCEVEVPELADYPAGGAYLLAFYAGVPLGEDELIEFSLPPAFGAGPQIGLIDALDRLKLLPTGQVLSLHITCETPAEIAEHDDFGAGMALISFCL
ncbi:MAG: hypothetical protein V2A77_08835, partial [Pseudomonadota bacterium]